VTECRNVAHGSVLPSSQTRVSDRCPHRCAAAFDTLAKLAFTLMIAYSRFASARDGREEKWLQILNSRNSRPRSICASTRPKGYELDRKDSWAGSAIMRHANNDKIVIKRDADGHCPGAA
jgi:hypothetical protein